MMMNLLKIILLIGLVFSKSISLDDIVAPFSAKISQDVKGNMTATLSIGRGQKFKHSLVQNRYIAKVHGKFSSKIPGILKGHLQAFLHKTTKSVQAAKRAALLAMVDLQKNLIRSALEENLPDSKLEKRDVLKTLILLEAIIAHIYQWKNDHPEAMAEIVKLEQSLINFVKPGPDGTFESSELALKLKQLNAAGISKYWMYPIVFGAGSISAVVIFGMFQWILSQDQQ